MKWPASLWRDEHEALQLRDQPRGSAPDPARARAARRARSAPTRGSAAAPTRGPCFSNARDLIRRERPRLVLEPGVAEPGRDRGDAFGPVMSGLDHAALVLPAVLEEEPARRVAVAEQQVLDSRERLTRRRARVARGRGTAAGTRATCPTRGCPTRRRVHPPVAEVSAPVQEPVARIGPERRERGVELRAASRADRRIPTLAETARRRRGRGKRAGRAARRSPRVRPEPHPEHARLARRGRLDGSTASTLAGPARPDAAGAVGPSRRDARSRRRRPRTRTRFPRATRRGPRARARTEARRAARRRGRAVATRGPPPPLLGAASSSRGPNASPRAAGRPAAAPATTSVSSTARRPRGGPRRATLAARPSSPRRRPDEHGRGSDRARGSSSAPSRGARGQSRTALPSSTIAPSGLEDDPQPSLSHAAAPDSHDGSRPASDAGGPRPRPEHAVRPAPTPRQHGVHDVLPNAALDERRRAREPVLPARARDAPACGRAGPAPPRGARRRREPAPAAARGDVDDDERRPDASSTPDAQAPAACHPKDAARAARRPRHALRNERGPRAAYHGP